jgi:hypothetical protein
LTGLFVLALPGGPPAPAAATHFGDVECLTSPTLVHDGRLTPGEYSENYFDPRTKILTYFSCLDDPNRTAHMAIKTPWEGWTEVRLQAADTWNGEFNAIRIRLAPEEGPGLGPSTHGVVLELIDGYVNGTGGSFVDDLLVGGSVDILEPAGGVDAGAYVYEFGIPMHSQDVRDCQWTVDGSFYFQLAQVLADPEAPAFLESDLGVIEMGGNRSAGRWTDVELSLPPGQAPLESAEILVSLRDGQGLPLAYKPVSVFVQTAFGFLELGTVTTNGQGAGSTEYRPRDSGDFLIGAAYGGGDGLLGGVTWHRISVSSPASETAWLPRNLLVIQTLIVLVVGGVWITYGYALLIVRRVLREDPEDVPRRPQGAWRRP